MERHQPAESHTNRGDALKKIRQSTECKRVAITDLGWSVQEQMNTKSFDLILSRIGNWSDATQCGVLIGIGVLMSGQLVIVRFIGEDISVFEIILFRALFGLLAVSGLIIRSAGTYLRPNRPGLAVLCGALGFGQYVFLPGCGKIACRRYHSDPFLVRPVFAALVAAVVLEEALRGSRVAAIIAGVVGAAIIVRPGLVEVNIGVLFVLGAVAVQSWNPINRKLLSKSDHPDTVAVWNILTILPLAAATSYFVWTTPTWEQVGWMALIGVLEITNQRILGRAYQRADAIVVVILHYTRLPIAALLGFWF